MIAPPNDARLPFTSSREPNSLCMNVHDFDFQNGGEDRRVRVHCALCIDTVRHFVIVEGATVGIFDRQGKDGGTN